MSEFDKLAAKLAAKPAVSDPRALAAVIGRKKYGAQAMAKGAANSKPAAGYAQK